MFCCDAIRDRYTCYDIAPQLCACSGYLKKSTTIVEHTQHDSVFVHENKAGIDIAVCFMCSKFTDNVVK